MRDFEALLHEVSLSAKYRTLAPAVIRRVAEREHQRTKSLKEALKQTKTTLHQITGAYQTQRPHYTKALKALEEAKQSGTETEWKTSCLRLLASHASTAERLPFLEEFYTRIFALIPPPQTILDLGCGLNPLTFPFMPLPTTTTYRAGDMDTEMTAFVSGFLRLAGVHGEGFLCDLLTPIDVEALCKNPVDLVFLFKVLPLLDQWDKSAAPALLRDLPAKTIVVSYPTRSLGGKGKGMAQNYTKRFESIVAGESWRITPLEFPNELCFVIEK